MARTKTKTDDLPTLEVTGEDLQQIEILNRRLQTPDLSGSTAIRLRNPALIARWINLDVYPGRYNKAVTLQGWRPVRVDDLVDRREVADLVVTPDGYVARGEKQREILHAMPREAFVQIQQAKANEVLRKRGGKELKNLIANRAATHPQFVERGVADEAAESIFKMKGEITDSLEQVFIDDGPQAE